MRYLTGRGPKRAVIVTTAAFLATIVVFGLYAARPAQAAIATLVGAGDIAGCNHDRDEATARLLDNIPGTVFTAGDNAYSSGTISQFQNCYGPTWGRHKARTRPSVGNHEYRTSGASGYFQYFGAAAGPSGKGYYSYNLGDWHHPVFTSGEHGNDPKMIPAFQILYDNNAELVINGHDHDYERFAPQTPSGTADPARGIREIVVGTGGAKLRPFTTIRPNSQVRNANTWGVIKLTLTAGSYSWQFVPVAGQTFTDSGTTSCH